jgi:hypothetical protein
MEGVELALKKRVHFVPEADSCTAASIRQGLSRGQFRVLLLSCGARQRPAMGLSSYGLASKQHGQTALSRL